MTVFYPKETVLEVVQEAKELFNCEVQFEMDETLGAVKGDEMRVKYILLCLVQEASIRSNNHDVRVYLDIANNEALNLSTWDFNSYEEFQERGHLVISVMDSGPCLPEKLQKIFELFARN